MSLKNLFQRSPSQPKFEGKNLYNFTVKNSNGEDISLSKYEGKVVMVVNTASKCGLTDQNYKELAEIDKKYRDQGLAILGFPCNQFSNQDPGSQEEICSFASKRYKIEFELFQKIDVNGSEADPLFVWLKAALPGFMGTEGIKWNFTKFLIDRKGHPFKRYGPQESPFTFEQDIQALLAKE